MPLPTGPAVTFLFTDIEGSTRLERSVGSTAWASIVGRHDALLRQAIEGDGGVVVKTEGDAFFAAFDAPGAAVRSAVAAQRALAAETWPGELRIRVRMGLHLGEGRLREPGPSDDREDYVGIDVNYTARIAAAANGGQVVASAALVDALDGGDGGRSIAPGAEIVLDGLRAVKDFDEPLPIYRVVVPGAAEDTRTLRTTEPPSNLPGEVTSLVGRETELDAVVADLAASRMVTLTGPGGSGKTRLALATARSVRDTFPHGTWFVDLAAVRDAALLERTIAVALGVRESAELPVEGALRAHLRGRTILLVLDNLEQLLPTVAGRVASLLREAPELRLLVTSRELLRIAGERGHAVPPLDVDAGVVLFLERARAHRSDLAGAESMAAVRAIAERLGGLPLGLELAAARTRLMSPAQILDRLASVLDLRGGPRDAPERQQTLRAAIAWSEELLPDPERRLFARLGVFASGWTTEAAAAVADPDGTLGIDVVDGLESLSDKSLVRIELPADDGAGGELRFGMHPLLREYALERLAATGEAPATERLFVAHCVAVAEQAGTAVLGATGEATMARLDREEHNQRRALDLAIAGGDVDSGLRVLGATWRWFQRRGRLRESRALLAGLLAAPGAVDPRVRIGALAAEGGLAYWMEDFDAAGVAYEERLRLAEEADDDVLVADAHYDLGFLAMVRTDGEALRAHERRALELYEAAGRTEAAVRARQALVLGEFLAGEYASAKRLEEQNLAAFRATGSEFETADSLTLLAGITWRLGEPGGAWARSTEALRFFAAADNASGIVRNLGMAAIIQLADGDPTLGARVAGATYRLMREKGVMLAPVKVLHLPEPRDLAVERLGAERAGEQIEAGEAMPLAEAVSDVLTAAAPAGRSMER